MITELLEAAVLVIPKSRLRITKTKAPMLVITGEDDTYALYYMKNARSYKLFWPWPSYGALQHNKNFKNPIEVRNFVNGR